MRYGIGRCRDVKPSTIRPVGGRRSVRGFPRGAPTGAPSGTKRRVSRMELTNTTTVGTASSVPVTPANADPFSRALLSAMLALRGGDFAVRMPTDLTGVNGKIAD